MRYILHDASGSELARGEVETTGIPLCVVYDGVVYARSRELETNRRLDGYWVCYKRCTFVTLVEAPSRPKSR